MELIKKYLVNHYFVCGVFIDLRKAIDTASHDILAKLEHCGVLGQANNCLDLFYKLETTGTYKWVLLRRKKLCAVFCKDQPGVPYYVLCILTTYKVFFFSKSIINNT